LSGLKKLLFIYVYLFRCSLVKEVELDAAKIYKTEELEKEKISISVYLLKKKNY